MSSKPTFNQQGTKHIHFLSCPINYPKCKLVMLIKISEFDMLLWKMHNNNLKKNTIHQSELTKNQ